MIFLNGKRLYDGFSIYLLLYVNDMLIARKTVKKIVKLKNQLNRKFEMNYSSETNKILGMEINRDKERGYLLDSKAMSEEGITLS